MGAESSAHARGDIAYYEREFQKAKEAAREAGFDVGLDGPYLERAVASGEPAGILVGAGCADLGLVAGAEITAEVAQKTWTDLLHPATGQPLGRRKFHFAGSGERLAKVAHDRGIELPAGLDPKAVRKAVMRGEVSDYTVSRRVAKHLRAEVSTEDLNDMRAEARTKAKEPCAYWDVTINASKDISLLQVALEAANQHERAALIEAALLKAAKAELAFLSEKVGSRMGTNGVKFVDAPNLAAVLYVHHFNRDGEPHLHVHMAVLNRVSARTARSEPSTVRRFSRPCRRLRRLASGCSTRRSLAASVCATTTTRSARPRSSTGSPTR